MKILKYFLLALLAITLPAHASITQQLTQLENSYAGHIGLSAINTANNERIQYRANESFPMCSTAKMLSVATVLQQSNKNTNLLKQKIIYKKSDLVDWSPVTEKHIADGMTVGELCAAAISLSDNTAINLLINKVGGFDPINAYVHSLGDNTSRVDRFEPAVSVTVPGDVRDTSTPASMENNLQKLALGNGLRPAQRQQLITWLKETVTGNARIPAGIPKGWVVGHKTGTGSNYGTTNDIAVIWPPKCSPIVVAIYYQGMKATEVKREAALATATRLIIKEFARNDQCLKV